MPENAIQSFRALSHATEYANRAAESENPHLWHRHLGTLAPCILGRQGENMRLIGGRMAYDFNNPGITVVNSPIGPACSKLGDAGAANRIALTQAGATLSDFKVDPPFTLSCIMRIPEDAASKHYRILFTTDMRFSALQKYAGIMICADDASSTNLLVMQYDNTGTILDEVVRTAAGPTIVQSDGSAYVNLQNWQHVVVRVSPTVQSTSVDSSPENHVRFWIKGIQMGSATANTGQGLAHAAAQYAAIGYVRTDATYSADIVEIALWQLWTRKLSIGEISQLCADPLAMMRPRKRIYSMPVAAATVFPRSYGYVMG